MIDNSGSLSLSVRTALAAMALTLASCGTGVDVPSEEVATSTLWADIELTAKGDGRTGVKVELNENSRNGNNVRLSPNERLEASAAGMIVRLAEDVDFADIDYEGILLTDAENAQFRISLFRADGTINNRSTANLPAAFEVTAPVTNQAFRVGETIALRWSPGSAGREMSVAFSTICSATGSNTSQFRRVADTGAFDFPTRDLFVGNVPASGTCDLEIDLTREGAGVLDPAFRGGGFVRTLQERQVGNMTVSQ